MPSKSVSSTPYELWTGRKPNLTHLRPWGSAAFVHDPSSKFGKLGPRGRKCIFIRYPEHSKGYVFIGEQADGSISELESRDVTFLENDFPQRGDITSDLDLFEIDESDTSTAPLQLIPQVEDNNEEFHPSGSDRNVNIPEEGQLRHNERTPYSSPSF